MKSTFFTCKLLVFNVILLIIAMQYKFFSISNFFLFNARMKHLETFYVNFNINKMSFLHFILSEVEFNFNSIENLKIEDFSHNKIKASVKKEAFMQMLLSGINCIKLSIQNQCESEFSIDLKAFLISTLISSQIIQSEIKSSYIHSLLTFK